MKCVLYDVEWQKLRVQFLADYQPERLGGWTTEEGVEVNLDKLDKYIFGDDLRISEEEVALRVYRGLNLLNATRMGYSGQGKTGSTIDGRVESYRNSLSTLHAMPENQRRVIKAGAQWNWSRVHSDLKILYIAEPTWFRIIQENLASRRKSALKRRAGTQYRPELEQFLELMERVKTSIPEE